MKTRIFLTNFFALCSLFFALNTSAQKPPHLLAIESADKIELKANQSMADIENQEIYDKENVLHTLEEINIIIKDIQSNLSEYASKINMDDIAFNLQEIEIDFYNIVGAPTMAGLSPILTNLQMVKFDIDIRIGDHLHWGGDFGNSGGSVNKNYIRTRTYTDVRRFIEQTQYFDGLGRANQFVQRGITHDQRDLVSITEYEGELQRQ